MLDTKKIRACCDLLTPPAPGVVRELCDEVDKLRDDLERSGVREMRRGEEGDELANVIFRAAFVDVKIEFSRNLLLEACKSCMRDSYGGKWKNKMRKAIKYAEECKTYKRDNL